MKNHNTDVPNHENCVNMQKIRKRKFNGKKQRQKWGLWFTIPALTHHRGIIWFLRITPYHSLWHFNSDIFLKLKLWRKTDFPPSFLSVDMFTPWLVARHVIGDQNVATKCFLAENLNFISDETAWLAAFLPDLQSWAAGHSAQFYFPF